MQPAQECAGRQHFDPERLLQRQQILVQRYDKLGPGGHGARQIRIVFWIEDRFHLRGVQPSRRICSRALRVAATNSSTGSSSSGAV